MTTHECIWKKRKYGNTHTHTVEHVAMHIWGFTFSSVFFFFCILLLYSTFAFFFSIRRALFARYYLPRRFYAHLVSLAIHF